jgi:hypothetical protein
VGRSLGKPSERLQLLGRRTAERFEPSAQPSTTRVNKVAV